MMDSGFCVSIVIVELERKGVYGASLIKNKKYWPKGVPGAAIDAHFEDKDVNHCEMLEASIYGLPFQVMCMKEPNYVMKIMCKWMTLDKFEGGQTWRDYLVDGVKTTKTFCYKQPFGMHYKFRHQVDDNNNRRNLPISVERTWATKFWEDRNCAWYLATSEVNTNLAWGHFRQDSKVDATLDFRRKLAHECLVNSIGVDKDNEDVGCRPLRTCRMP